MKHWIKADIKERGLTREAYAELLGVKVGQVYRWLQGVEPSAPVKLLMTFSTAALKTAAKKAAK